MPAVHTNPPPPGFSIIQVGKKDPVPHNAIQALDIHNHPIKRCYYVPVNNISSKPSIPSYLPGVQSMTQQTQYQQPPIQQRAQPPSHGSSQWSEVVNQGFTFPTQKRYLFKESAMSISDGAATVFDLDQGEKKVATINGAIALRGGSRDIYVGSRKVASVGKGALTFDIKKMIKKELGLVKSGLNIFKANGDKVGSISEKPFQLGAGSRLTMADGRVVDITASFRAKKFEAAMQGTTLFIIEHKTSAKSLLMGKDNYEITVMPYVDSLLAISSCLILEDLFRPEQ